MPTDHGHIGDDHVSHHRVGHHRVGHHRVGPHRVGRHRVGRHRVGPHRVGRRVAARVGRLRRQVRGPRELLLLAQVIAVAAAVPLLVRLPLPRQAALLVSRKKGRPAAPDDVERLARLVELAQDVARPLVRPGCLTRGITLYWFLGRADRQVELCFGIGHPGAGEEYSGHCWLTRDGQPFLERVDPTESFPVMYRIPVASR